MSEWQNTATDNIVLISESGTILATVFVRPNGWGAVVNWDHLHGASRHATDGRFLRGTWAAPDGAKAAVEAVLQAGTDSPLLQPTPNCAWKRIKRGMGYWRRDRGATLTVKQAASQAWYATLDGEQPARLAPDCCRGRGRSGGCIRTYPPRLHIPTLSGLRAGYRLRPPPSGGGGGRAAGYELSWPRSTQDNDGRTRVIIDKEMRMLIAHP